MTRTKAAGFARSLKIWLSLSTVLALSFLGIRQQTDERHAYDIFSVGIAHAEVPGGMGDSSCGGATSSSSCSTDSGSGTTGGSAADAGSGSSGSGSSGDGGSGGDGGGCCCD